SEGGDRRRPADAVGLEAGPALEEAQRALGVHPEAAVDGRGGESVPREQELKRGDVPARRPALELAAAEGVSAVAPKRLAGCRADDPIGRQAGALLEALDGARRRWGALAVDAACVETARPQPNLQRSHVGVAFAECRRGE